MEAQPLVLYGCTIQWKGAVEIPLPPVIEEGDRVSAGDGGRPLRVPHNVPSCPYSDKWRVPPPVCILRQEWERFPEISA